MLAQLRFFVMQTVGSMTCFTMQRCFLPKLAIRTAAQEIQDLQTGATSIIDDLKEFLQQGKSFTDFMEAWLHHVLKVTDMIKAEDGGQYTVRKAQHKADLHPKQPQELED